MITLRHIALAALFTIAARAQDPIPVKAGASLQAAIDAAPAGAILKLDPGEWKERIVIAKPLTLEGAGWEKSVLKPDQHDLEAAARRRTLDLRYLEPSSPSEKDQLAEEYAAGAYEPTIFIHDTKNVTIRGLRVGGKLFANRQVKEVGFQDPLVLLQKSEAAFSDCVFAGYYYGINVSRDCAVELRRSLVAGMWWYGIHVAPGARLQLIESDVRNCYGSGASFDPQSGPSRLERCRFSGFGWHGIDYRDAALTIAGCRFFSAERSSIYASSKGRAEITGNVFQDRGVWCLTGSTDRIEGNTFLNLPDTAVSIGVGGNPVVARNLFAASGTAVSFHPAPGNPAPQLEENWFWRNTVNYRFSDADRPAPDGNIERDPKFSAPGNPLLAQDSPARAAHVGAADPLSLESPWPLLAEEKAMIPDGDTHDYRYWKTPGYAAPSKPLEALIDLARETSQTWVADALQVADKPRRDAALERIRQAMGGGDPAEARAGVVAFNRLETLTLERSSFRPALRKLLASADPVTRAAAAKAFSRSGAARSDWPVLFALADDPSDTVRAALPAVLVTITNRDLTVPEASSAMLKVLDYAPPEPGLLAREFYGAKLSPALEARVLQLCEKVDYETGFFWLTLLGYQANKSEAVCRRLIELLANPNGDLAYRAAMALEMGVAKAQYPMVADAMLQVLETRTDPTVRQHALSALKNYVGAAQVPGIEALLARPGPDLDRNLRAELKALLKTISPEADAANAREQLAAENAAKASAQAKPWVADMFQLADAAKRNAAVDQMRTAMNSLRDDDVRAGLTAFRRVGPIEFDKASFRPAIRKALASPDASMRAAALECVTIAGADPADLSTVCKMVADPTPEIRSALPRALVLIAQRDLTGQEVSAALVKLIDDPNTKLSGIAQALGGCKFSPEIEARVLNFCREVDKEPGSQFLYSALTNQQNKSEAVCKRLIELLEHPEIMNIAGHAAWGLGFGVAKEQKKLVADAMLSVVESREQSELRDRAFETLRYHASPSHGEALKTLLAKRPDATPEFRKEVDLVLEFIAKRQQPQ